MSFIAEAITAAESAAKTASNLADFQQNLEQTEEDNNTYNNEQRILKLEQERANLDSKMANMIPQG